MINLTKLVTNIGETHLGERENEKDKDHIQEKYEHKFDINPEQTTVFMVQYCTPLQMKSR
jgi:hypothetical protein